VDKARILLVDDERVILDLLERFVLRLDVNVDCAESGAEAVALMEESFYHLFIVDLLMPGMNGIELLEHVKQASPDSEVIILTGYGDMQSAVQAMRGGAYDYFQKPFEDSDVFLLAVQRALDKQRLTVERRKLIEELKAATEHIEGQRIQELQHIRDIGAAYAGSLKRDEIVRVLHKALLVRAGVEVVGFWLTGPSFDDKEWLVHAESPLDESVPLELRSIAERKLVEMGLPVPSDAEAPVRVVTDESSGRNAVLAGPLRSSIVEPMRSRDELQGMVAVASTGESAFSEDSERLIGILAGQALIALQNEAMFRRMANLAIRDGLTGLFNHRHFYDLLQVEFDRSERYGRQFSLIMVDTDGLKMANDTFGHLAGDQVLRELAVLFMEETRESDVVARYGGDEFTLILPETQTEPAVALAERLRGLVEEHQFMCGDARIAFTISAGVATYVPGQGMTLPDLVGRADMALYRAKSLGRNRVSAHGAR